MGEQLNLEIPTQEIPDHDPEAISGIARRQIANLKARMQKSMRPDVYIHEINKIILFENNKR